VALLANVAAILAEYAAYLPLTVRQIFYRLVAHYDFPKTERGYNGLDEHLVRARRAGLLPWEAFREDRTQRVYPPGFAGQAAFWLWVWERAEGYRRQLFGLGGKVVEAWVEATGMLPQVTRVAHEFGVLPVAAGGFDSVQAKHDAARGMIDLYDQVGLRTEILHVVDYDPSGCSKADALAEDIDALAEDIDAFCRDYERPGIVSHTWAILTADQVSRYQLPSKPQNDNDRRGEHMPETWQAEALAPDDLATELRKAMEAATDDEAIAEARAAERHERAEILSEVGGILACFDDEGGGEGEDE
jgi:hypothetical protein